MKTDIPWKFTRLDNKELFRIKYGKGRPKKEGKIPVIGSSGVYAYSKVPLVEPPVIIIGRKGNAGSVQLIDEPCWASDTTFYLKLKKPNLNYKFLSEYLTYRSPSNSKTQTTLPSLSSDDLYNIPVPVPPLVEQRGIAEVLGTVDEAIRASDMVIEKTELLKRGLMQRLLTEGIGHTEYKETKLGRIPKAWKMCKITELVSTEKNAIKTGPFGSSLKKEYYTKKGYKIYGQEQVIPDDFAIGNYYVSEKKFKELSNYEVKPFDVLISLVGTYGKVSIVPNGIEKGIINPRLLKITPDNVKINSYYLKYLLTSNIITTQLKRLSHGATMGIINTKIIKELLFPIPSIKEQKKIISLLDCVQNKCINEKITKGSLLEIKQGLMQLLLSGKVRVELGEDGLYRIG